MPKEAKKYGWFSAKAVALAGSCFYKTPNGSTVEGFEITYSPHPSSGWSDMEFLGEVTDWVKKGRTGSDKKLEIDPYKKTFADVGKRKKNC